jgi:internalin A
VLNYFREIEAQGVDHLYEAKVLIIGGGGAGKTSLVRRLYQPGQPLPSEDETNRGIAIHRHDFQSSGKRTFRLNIWDFGGQQIYHATHQFFLTKNSLYVLVDDTRKNDRSAQDDGFKYWLEVVEVLSGHSPVLIFQNEKGGRSKQIDEAGIKRRFTDVQETYRGNLEEPHAADDLGRAIEYQTQKLPHIGEEVPAKWPMIRNAIEAGAERDLYISQEDYFDNLPRAP